jgi:hypothetical protein
VPRPLTDPRAERQDGEQDEHGFCEWVHGNLFWMLPRYCSRYCRLPPGVELSRVICSR